MEKKNPLDGHFDVYGDTNINIYVNIYMTGFK